MKRAFFMPIFDQQTLFTQSKTLQILTTILWLITGVMLILSPSNETRKALEKSLVDQQ